MEGGDPEFRKLDYTDIQRFDPNTNLHNIQTDADVRQQLHIDREHDAQQLLKVAQSKKPNGFAVIAQLYGTQIGLSIICGLGTAGLLYWINPPLTQYSRKDDVTVEKQDWKKVLITVIIVIILVFIAPEILTLLKVLG